MREFPFEFFCSQFLVVWLLALDQSNCAALIVDQTRFFAFKPSHYLVKNTIEAGLLLLRTFREVSTRMATFI
jgi:hypothetical protein